MFLTLFRLKLNNRKFIFKLKLFSLLSQEIQIHQQIQIVQLKMH